LGGIAEFLTSLGPVYAIGAGVTLYQLARSWREFFGGRLTQRAAQIAGGVAFFLLVPVGVLLHELAHMLAVWTTGSRVTELGYFVYWGYVSYIPSSESALQEWYVALAGNAASFALGVVSLIAALRLAAARPTLALVLLYLGILEVIQTLVIYPLLSVDPNFDGDWDAIYSFKAPLASGATLAVHLLALGAFVVFINRNGSARRLMRAST
jgi:hypothetical protein